MKRYGPILALVFGCALLAASCGPTWSAGATTPAASATVPAAAETKAPTWKKEAGPQEVSVLHADKKPL